MTTGPSQRAFSFHISVIANERRSDPLFSRSPGSQNPETTLSPKAIFIFSGFGDSRCKGKSHPLYFKTPVAEVPTRANRARCVPEMDDLDEYLNVGPLLA